jgi:hypothetical protein
MKAIAVHPGRPGSIHLADVPEPHLEDVADGKGVLARILRVGVDATDREINAGEYGASPPGGPRTRLRRSTQGAKYGRGMKRINSISISISISKQGGALALTGLRECHDCAVRRDGLRPGRRPAARAVRRVGVGGRGSA